MAVAAVILLLIARSMGAVQLDWLSDIGWMGSADANAQQNVAANGTSASSGDADGTLAADDTASDASATASTIDATTADTSDQPAAGVAPSEERLALGADVFDLNCASCHAEGWVGAPMAGNLEAWENRLPQGLDTMYRHAIDGFGEMPPRGGGIKEVNGQY